MRLLGSNVLLRRLPASTRFGAFIDQSVAEIKEGLLLPGAGRVEGLSIVLPTEVIAHDSFECEVLSVGPGEILPNGSRETIGIVPGERVLVYQGVGTELEDNQFIVDISAIEAVIEL